jgi:hypothetical protein
VPEPLDDVLRLVAAGRLSPDEAAPIIEALASAREAAARGRAAGNQARDSARAAGAAGAQAGPSGPPRRLRIEVRDGGRTAVDLQLPGVLAELAGAVPGIPPEYADRVREALRTGIRGPIVDVRDEDGSGVTITLE